MNFNDLKFEKGVKPKITMFVTNHPQHTDTMRTTVTSVTSTRGQFPAPAYADKEHMKEGVVLFIKENNQWLLTHHCHVSAVVE